MYKPQVKLRVDSIKLALVISCLFIQASTSSLPLVKSANKKVSRIFLPCETVQMGIGSSAIGVRSSPGQLSLKESQLPPSPSSLSFPPTTTAHPFSPPAGIVHRDIKPENCIVSEKERKLKMIDLGAAADLRTGRNYHPQEGLMDGRYAPPQACFL